MNRQVVLLGILTAGMCAAQQPLTWGDWLNRGTAAFQSAKYAEAAEAFQHAVDLYPGDYTARFYLATSYMSQWIPGADSPDNVYLARRAREEFEAALRLKPNDANVLQSLAYLSFNEAAAIRDPIEKNRKLDEAAEWHRKSLEVDTRNKQAYYNLGVIAWSKFYPELMQARAKVGLKPGDPGPLPDFNARQDLRNRLGPVVEDGIANLQKALEIDPSYDDAMAYMNLLIRERADLRDTPEEYRRDIAVADQWVQKALDTKKARGGVIGGVTGSGPVGGIVQELPNTSPVPPPPPPRRVRVGANANNLISKVDPIYPEMARQARIQGLVRFTAVIGRDGHIQNLQLVSGHPLLVPAAQEAVRQWVYRPTLLNGEAVEVVTNIDVAFTLPQ